MNRLQTSFVVVMVLALWLGSTAAVSAKDYEKEGMITKVDRDAKTFDLQCSDPEKGWPGISYKDLEDKDANLFESLMKWKEKKTVLTVKFIRKGDRHTAISILSKK